MFLAHDYLPFLAYISVEGAPFPAEDNQPSSPPSFRNTYAHIKIKAADY
jgi:hypothetical protein